MQATRLKVRKGAESLLPATDRTILGDLYYTKRAWRKEESRLRVYLNVLRVLKFAFCLCHLQRVLDLITNGFSKVV